MQVLLDLWSAVLSWLCFPRFWCGCDDQVSALRLTGFGTQTTRIKPTTTPTTASQAPRPRRVLAPFSFRVHEPRKRCLQVSSIQTDNLSEFFCLFVFCWSNHERSRCFFLFFSFDFTFTDNFRCLSWDECDSSSHRETNSCWFLLINLLIYYYYYLSPILFL